MKRLTIATVAIFMLFSVHSTAGESTAGEGAETAEALFAGGCFWCMQPPFDELEGVKETIVGYSGGHVEDPFYRQVVAGGTGHREVLKVLYDPEKISYQQLLGVYWRNVDPLDDGGQFCDRGEPYQAAIFAMNEEQMAQALASKEAIEASGRFDQPVVTDIMEAENFYRGEEYHQNYYQKNPLRYQFYSRSCGRYSRLDALWED